MRHDGGNTLKSQDHHEWLRTLPLNPGECVIYLLEVRFLFFNSFSTVVGLTCNTRAVSRIPLAFMAISTIWRLTSGDCPA
jgi:hypothetical protein